ncbi:hypothetical protein SLEP1_g52601 [Rubroshorea leprosula]|uniref:Uncharacterized protein n=1 Tax=Rubroshorea leprosula TaxID=152421 RepID=A0AAV5M9G1_9ROSI|nr:hypothetical protein SLEP1_g52601 [Rubroshorea leprosula]
MEASKNNGDGVKLCDGALHMIHDLGICLVGGKIMVRKSWEKNLDFMVNLGEFE